MATKVEVWPKIGETYPDAAGVTITAAGAIVWESKYIEDAIRDGHLLTYDPYGVNLPVDHTDVAPPAPRTASYVLATSAPASLEDARRLAAGAGIALTDSGPGGTLTVSATGGGGGGGAPVDAEYLVSTASTGLSAERVLTAGAGITLTPSAGALTVASSVAAGAPADAPYLTLSGDARLSGERALAAGPGIAIDDGGANGAATVRHRFVAGAGIALTELPTGEVEIASTVVVPTGGQTWGAIYELDLTTLPTQTLVNGANLVDGLTWYSKGTADFIDTVVNNIVNGLGMECGSGAFGVTGNYSNRIPWFPFAQLPDFNPAAPVAVAWRWSGSGMSSSNYMVGGLASMANNGTQWLSAERASQAIIEYQGQTDRFLHYVEGDASGLAVVMIAPPSATSGDHAFVEAQLESQVYCSGHAAYAGSLPNNVHGLTSGVNPRLSVAPRPNIGFFMARNRSTAFTVYLTHLAVLQPVVPVP
jgi:hypothetical protein